MVTKQWVIELRANFSDANKKSVAMNFQVPNPCLVLASVICTRCFFIYISISRLVDQCQPHIWVNVHQANSRARLLFISYKLTRPFIYIPCFYVLSDTVSPDENIFFNDYIFTQIYVAFYTSYLRKNFITFTDQICLKMTLSKIW